MILIGTRPEAVKLSMIIKLIKKDERFKTIVCSTGQHREMLNQMFKMFNIFPDIDLNIMEENQTLTQISKKIMELLQNSINVEKPDLLIVQGDTTSAFIASIVAFYNRINIAHVEAGLRTYNKWEPYPEEINRRLISSIADFHFAPTENAKKNLLKENIDENNIYVTGNTVVDALEYIKKLWNKKGPSYLNENLEIQYINSIKEKYDRLILVTCHRRENFGRNLENIVKAIEYLAEKYRNIGFMFPVHLNPSVRTVVFNNLSNLENVHLMEPLNYESLLYLISISYLILTDSGGIQEEAPSFGIPVLILRRYTERSEALEKGWSLLVGSDKNNIINISEELINNESVYIRMKPYYNPFGDGKASERILNILREKLL